MHSVSVAWLAPSIASRRFFRNHFSAFSLHGVADDFTVATHSRIFIWMPCLPFISWRGYSESFVCCIGFVDHKECGCVYSDGSHQKYYYASSLEIRMLVFTMKCPPHHSTLLSSSYTIAYECRAVFPENSPMHYVTLFQWNNNNILCWISFRAFSYMVYRGIT